MGHWPAKLRAATRPACASGLLLTVLLVSGCGQDPVRAPLSVDRSASAIAFASGRELSVVAVAPARRLRDSLLGGAILRVSPAVSARQPVTLEQLTLSGPYRSCAPLTAAVTGRGSDPVAFTRIAAVPRPVFGQGPPLGGDPRSVQLKLRLQPSGFVPLRGALLRTPGAQWVGFVAVQELGVGRLCGWQAATLHYRFRGRPFQLALPGSRLVADRQAFRRPQLQAQLDRRGQLLLRGTLAGPSSLGLALAPPTRPGRLCLQDVCRRLRPDALLLHQRGRRFTLQLSAPRPPATQAAGTRLPLTVDWTLPLRLDARGWSRAVALPLAPVDLHGLRQATLVP